MRENGDKLERVGLGFMFHRARSTFLHIKVNKGSQMVLGHKVLGKPLITEP